MSELLVLLCFDSYQSLDEFRFFLSVFFAVNCVVRR